MAQVGDGGKCHHLHFDETMEILIGYAVLQIGSIVTNLNACSSIEKFVPPCRGSMETRRRLFASLESKQEKLGKRYDSADFWLEFTPRRQPGVCARSEVEVGLVAKTSP